MTDPIWNLRRGHGPLVATALHDGHHVRHELRQFMAIDDARRLLEEDPFTGRWTSMAPTRIVGRRSRFEVDLNRPREKCVYRTSEDAWGLRVWNGQLPDDVVERSLAEYDAFYRAIEGLYGELIRQHGKIVVFDLHAYNYRRNGPDAPPADPESHPQVNIGTGTMKSRERFAGLIERFRWDLRRFEFPGGQLDVRENVKFFGGFHPRWTHQRFPDTACVLAVEWKKFFMDEWTGEPKMELVEAIGDALAATVPGVLEELAKI